LEHFLNICQATADTTTALPQETEITAPLMLRKCRPVQLPGTGAVTLPNAPYPVRTSIVGVCLNAAVIVTGGHVVVPVQVGRESHLQ